MQPPPQCSKSTGESIPGVCKAEGSTDPFDDGIETLRAEPTHNGHGSIGDGKEPAWFMLDLNVVRVPMISPPMPPMKVIIDSEKRLAKWRGITFSLKGATQLGIPYDSNWRSWIFDAMADPEGPVVPLLVPAPHGADQDVMIYFRVSKVGCCWPRLLTDALGIAVARLSIRLRTHPTNLLRISGQFCESFRSPRADNPGAGRSLYARRT